MYICIHAPVYTLFFALKIVYQQVAPHKLAQARTSWLAQYSFPVCTSSHTSPAHKQPYKLQKYFSARNIRKMLAGNIQFNDKLDKYSKIADIIDISGSLETSGKKDISKINFFLENINKLKN